MKVLIVEDEEPMRRAFCNCFIGQGVAQAADLPEAIKALDGEAFDLVLADLILPPTKEPSQTLAQIRRHSLGAVVIVISGGDISPEIAAAADGAILKAEIRNCIQLRAKINEIIEAVKKRPPYDAHVRAVGSWALAYGELGTSAQTPSPGQPSGPSMSMHRPLVGAL